MKRAVTVALILYMFLTVHSQKSEIMEYTEETNGKRTMLTISITTSEDDRIIVRKQSENEYYKITNMNTLTTEFSYENKVTGLSYDALRNGYVIQVTGKDKTKKIIKSFKIDDYGWEQSIELSLAQLVLSTGKDKRFWLVSLDAERCMKMYATNKGMEELQINGEKVNAIKIEVTPDGFFSIFWKAFFWYDQNGLYLKSRCSKDFGAPECITEIYNY
ncbi:MAG TPA: hypothetical protein PK741_07675 [Petrotogaceae bacterium]|nr:hypothetical protein [Petrotogaceae bacterium]